MANNIPITEGSGAASVAAETISGISYQQIEVYGGGGSSVLSINPDGSLNASIIGTPAVSISGNASVSGTVGASIIGQVPAFIVGGSLVGTSTANQSVSGTVDVGNLPTNQNVSGSVVAFQGTSPFIITGSIQGAAAGTSSVIQQGVWRVSVMSSQPSSMLVGASIIGLVPVNIVSGGTTGSVSGTVGASVIGWVPIQPSNTSTIGVIQGSVATVIVGGSIAASFTPPANQSVSGAVSVSNFPTTQNVSGSVVSFQGSVPWIVTGSVQGSFSPAANQSVSGTVQTDVRGSVATVIIGGSIAASFTPPANQSVSGTVTTNQGTSPWIITGSVQGSFSPSGNQSVSGTVGASVIGHAPVVIVGGSVAVATGNSSVQVLNFPSNTSVSGAVSISNFPTNQSVSGTVGASIVGTIPTTQSGTRITSIVSTVPSSVIVGASIFGLAPVNVTNTNLNVAGSVVAFQGTNPFIITGSVQGAFSPSGNQSVSGTVNIGTGGPVSVTGTMSVLGTVPVTIVSGSIAAVSSPTSVMLLNGGNTIGSVTALQGTNPWIITSSIAGGIFPISGSVAAVITNTNVNVSGSVAAYVVGSSSLITVWKAPSIVGTYAEDSQHTIGENGIFVLGVRNDTMASVQGSDEAYSQFTVGPSGEQITAPAPLPNWIQGVADLRVVQGASVTAINAQGTSVFTYIQGVQVANYGSSSVLVKFGGGLGSTLGWTIAPAGGGSNIRFVPALKTGANSAFTASINGTASVLISAQGFTAKI